MLDDGISIDISELDKFADGLGEVSGDLDAAIRASDGTQAGIEAAVAEVLARLKKKTET